MVKKKYLLDLLKSRVISEDYAQFYHNLPSTDCLPAHLEQESEDEEENCEDDIHETADSNELSPANADEKVSNETHSNCDIPTIITIELCKHLTSGDSNGCKRLLCPAMSRRRNGTEHNQSASELFHASVPVFLQRLLREQHLVVQKIVHSRKQLKVYIKQWVADVKE